MYLLGIESPQKQRKASPSPELSSRAADGLLCSDAKGQQGLAMQDAIMQLKEGQAKVLKAFFS